MPTKPTPRRTPLRTPRLSPSEKLRDTARHILDALAADTIAASRIVADLETLCSLDHWDVEQHTRYGACKQQLGALLERYRTGASIIDC